MVRISFATGGKKTKKKTIASSTLNRSKIMMFIGGVLPP